MKFPPESISSEWESKYFYQLTPNFASPCLRYLSPQSGQLRLADEYDFVAPNSGLPIQPVAFIEHHFKPLWWTRQRPVRSTEKDVDLRNIRIQALLVRRKDYRGMIALRKRKRIDVPLLHSRFGSGTTFAEANLLSSAWSSFSNWK